MSDTNVPAGGATYSVNVWGYGDTAGPDVVPDTGWLGLRANCQLGVNGVGGALSNVQTGLAINGPGPEFAGGGASGPPKVKFPGPASFRDIEKAVRHAASEIGRRMR